MIFCLSPPGDIVALTGDSGTGKSTFVKMLNKFLKGDGIRINDCDLHEISNRFIREKVYYLAQNSYLLPFSIKDNITLGAPHDILTQFQFHHNSRLSYRLTPALRFIPC